jgi:hypothetical protein
MPSKAPVSEPDWLKVADGWVRRWQYRLGGQKLELLEAIPHPGLAKPSHWKDCVPGTTKIAGRNHPDVGAWLARKYGDPKKSAADPMVSVGGLWLKTKGLIKRLHANDCEFPLVFLAQENLVLRRQIDALFSGEDAVSWRPPGAVHLILTSPVFGQNHSSGATRQQKSIRKDKDIYAVQAFQAKAPGNLAHLAGPQYWATMLRIYAQMRSYLSRAGTAVVLLRNHVRSGKEVDDVGNHLALMSIAGFRILGLHPRKLEPTMYNRWHFEKSGRPYVGLEWAVCLEP